MANEKSPNDVGDEVAAILAELEAEIEAETEVVAPAAKPGSSQRITLTSKKSAPPVPGLPGRGGPGGPGTAPVRRTVLEGQLVAAAPPELVEDGTIRMKGQVSEDESECTILVSRNVLDGFSWYFDSEEAAAGSPMAERLMALPHVTTVLIDESTVLLSRPERIWDDWEPIAKEAGAIIRSALNGEFGTVSDGIRESVPGEETIREQVQHVLDTEVNPGVAAHEGHITLERVRGNSVYIKMGGGCQGCSVADVTLKQGIHGAFRAAVPGIGAIYDETDHSAGLNPYFA